MFHKFLDESEIDEWFNDEKDKLSEEFYSKSFKGNTEDGKALYEKRLKKLIDRFNYEHKKLIEKEERKERFFAPFKLLKSRFVEWKISFHEFRAEKKEQRKKKRFNKNYSKMMGR